MTHRQDSRPWRWRARPRRRHPIAITALAAVAMVAVTTQSPAAAAAPTPGAWPLPIGEAALGQHLAGLATVPAAPMPATPAVAAAIQRDLGIAVDQIAARQRRDAIARVAEESLRAVLDDGYGGAWLSPDGTLNVGVTTNRHDSVVRAAGGTPRTVAYSEQQLDTAKAALDRHAEAANEFVYGWAVDLPTNRVVIEVEPGHASAAEAFAAAAGVDRRMVRVEAIPGPYQRTDTTELRAGQGFVDVIAGAIPFQRCSIGFAVEGGFVTAGHCNTAGKASFPVIWTSPTLDRPTGLKGVGTWEAWTYPTHDYGWISTRSHAPTLPEVVGLGSVAGSREAIVGSTVCRSGAATGVRCGTILWRNKTVKDGDNWIYGLTETDACAEPGDSGGPFMSGDQAQGIASTVPEGHDCSNGGHSLFQPINPVLSAYNLTLKTVHSSPAWWNTAPGNSDRGTLDMDIDGDGYSDVVTFYQHDDRATIYVFEGSANGLNAPRALWDSGPTGRRPWDKENNKEEDVPYDLTRAKLVGGNFDGKAGDDIALLYDYGSAHAKLFMFTSSSQWTTTLSDPIVKLDTDAGNWYVAATRLIAGDVDGDRDEDIVAFYDYGNNHARLLLFANDGHGQFGPPTTVWDDTYWAAAASTLVVGNFDGRPGDDIGIFYDYGGTRTRLHLFTWNGKDFSKRIAWDSLSSWSMANTRLVTGDFDNDRDDEIGVFVGKGDQTKLYLFVADANGAFTKTLVWDSGTTKWSLNGTRVVGGNFDGNPGDDIAVLRDVDANRMELVVFGSDGTGKFTISSVRNTGLTGWSSHDVVPV